MLNQFFVHMAPPDANNVVQIRRGQVKAKLDDGFWLLQFRGQGYKFNQVVQTNVLANFTFFDKEAEGDAWLAELTAAKPAADDPIAPAPAADPFDLPSPNPGDPPLP